MKPVEIDQAAELEIWQVLAWYETNRPEGLNRFLSSLKEAMAFIESNPSAGSTLREEFRRVLLKHSPYYVIYKEYGSYSKIYAVMHARRKPGYWTNRISENKPQN